MILQLARLEIRDFESLTSRGVPLFDGGDEDERAEEADGPCGEERRLGREFPEQAADSRRGRDREALDQAVLQESLFRL